LSSPKKKKIPKLVCDASAWLQAVFGFEESATKVISCVINGRIIAIANSYCVLEVLRGAKRIAGRFRLPPGTAETRIWNIFTKGSVQLVFDQPLDESIIRQARKKAEYQILSQTLGLEPKDIPYVVLAFDKRAPLVTTDIRSLYSRRSKIERITGIRIMNPKQFLETL